MFLKNFSKQEKSVLRNSTLPTLIAGAGVCSCLCLWWISQGGLGKFFAQPGMYAALLGGSAAALATALGTLPVLFSKEFNTRTFDAFIAFGGGVMLAATAFSLMVPAFEAAHELWASNFFIVLVMSLGMGAGGTLVLCLYRAIAHHQARLHGEATQSVSLRTAWLLTLAIAIHNIPEGMAIGVAYAGVELDRAHALATGVSIQDLPEGLIIAVALSGAGYGRLFSMLVGALSGLSEPVAALIGVQLISLTSSLLPGMLAMAAGAMLIVVLREIIPQTYRSASPVMGSATFLLGFVVMFMLDSII